VTGHLDLDALADVLAGEPAPAHLAGCADCTAALDELRTAQAKVTGALADLPAVPVPTDVAKRIDSALGAARPQGSVTTLPVRTAPRRWLPAAAAVVLLLAGSAYALNRLVAQRDHGSATSAAGAKAPAAPTLDVVRNNSGANYTGRDALAAAVPSLLAGTGSSSQPAPAPAGGAGAQQDATVPSGSAPQTQSRAVADPLAGLRDNAGLADCLLALLPPDDPSVRPLALDYATYRGAPALIVLLPGSRAGKLDIFVVGPGCSRANDSTLFYTSVDKP
jgi:hypothetical protein